MSKFGQFLKKGIAKINDGADDSYYYSEILRPLLLKNEEFKKDWDEFYLRNHLRFKGRIVAEYLRPMLFYWDKGLYSEWSHFLYENRNRYNEYAMIRKFFDKDRLEESLRRKIEGEKRHKEFEEENKREYSIKRVYSYKYEDFIFSLFSPFAFKLVERYCVPLDACLPKGFILKKMIESSICLPKEVDSLFEEFVNQDLLSVEYHLNEETDSLEKTDLYKMGLTLGAYANVISSKDMNITKWIEKNGQTKSASDLQREVEQFNRKKH